MPQSQNAIPRGCTFAESDWRILADYWYPVALASEVTDKPVAATLLDQRLVLFRTASKGVVAANDLCIHRGVPLSMGHMDGEEIVCAYHGLRYDAEGQCVCIPADPEGAISPRLRLAMYPAVERYGLIWVCLSGKPANVLPEIPEWDDPTYQTALPAPIDLNASAGRQLEGFMDVAHFAWVHHETFGDRNNPYVPTYSVDRTDYGLHIEYRSTVGNYMRQDGSETEPEQGVLRVFDCYLPFTARLTVHLPDGGRLVILDSASPISARHTRLFAPLLRNYDLDTPLQPFIDYNVKIFNEDQAIVESQYPEDLPLDLIDEVHIRADKTSVAYRRALAKLGLGHSFTS
ncbi:MAG TPA: aromatic ring-hydroxylating dioxygenase subunit alpha [Pirellulales bacterium]|jgi:vanillate O-demethylase monooxygenase subunit|nr:aromatic ring-hydroxylating dioxygenase subunit alpha [Pirellulales bacterium]